MKKMINKIMKNVVVATLGLAMIVNLNACGDASMGTSDGLTSIFTGEGGSGNGSSSYSGEETAVASAYIIDNTKFAPVYDYEKLFVESIAQDFMVKGSSAIVIAADSNPRVIDTFVSEGKDKLASKSSNEKYFRKEAKKVVECMEGVIPDDGELNLIKAMNIAFDELSAYGDDTKKNIVVVSSFLNTCNPLNMTEGGLANINVSGVVDSLMTNKELKTGMTGITVNLYGMGHVAPGLEQGEPSNAEREGMEELYTEMFSRCGVDDCVVQTDTPSGDVDLDFKRTLPDVSVVATNGSDNAYSAITPEEVVAEDFDLCTGYIEFPEGSSLSFKAGSAEYLSSQEEVAEMLTPIVNWANNNSGETIAVFASTASAGTEDELMTLAEARAETVRDSLVSLGLDSSRIQVFPLGYELNPYKHKDTTDEGSFIEDEGKKNRVVYISTVSSAAAEPFFNEINK